MEIPLRLLCPLRLAQLSLVPFGFRLMKLIRILLVGIVGIALFVSVVIALAFNSQVQTWAARRAIASQPDLNLQIGSVKAGLNVTRVENIHFTQPGLSLLLPSAEVAMSLADAAGSRVAVKRVVAKGWTLDLSKPVPARGGNQATVSAKPSEAVLQQSVVTPDQTMRQAFAGVFHQLKLPVDFSLDGLDVEGDVILPGGQGAVHVIVSGGNIGTGQDGAIVFKAVLASAKKDAPVADLSILSDIIVRMDTPRSFEHLAATTKATVKGGQFPNGAEVQIVVDVLRGDKGGEAYSAVLRTGEKELVNFSARLPEGAAPLAGTWTLDVHDADLAPFILGMKLPEFAATGQGTVSMDRALTEIHASGQLKTTVDRLATLSPELSGIGRVKFTTDFDVTRLGDVIRIDRFNSQLMGANPVLSIATLQVLKFNPTTHVLQAASSAEDLFKISVQGLPLAWSRPFLPGFEIAGDDLCGEFAASARDGGFTLRPVTPLAINKLSVAQGGRPLVTALDVSLSVGGDYTPKGWQVEISDFSLVSGASTMFRLNARAGQLAGANQPVKATVAFESDLATALAQPAAPSGLSLAQGVVRGDVTASLDEKQEFAVTLQLANLESKAHQALPSVAFYLRADRAANGQIDAQAPIVITNAGRKSDLTVGTSVQVEKSGFKIDAQLKSEALYVEDLKLFSGLFAPTASVPPDAQPAPATAPTMPSAPTATPAGALWANVSGELKLELKKVIYSPAFAVSDIGGAVKITPEAVSLDALRAVLGGEGTLKAGGSLSYDGRQADAPYGLNADVAIASFDPAPLLRGLDPTKPVAVEGKFDLITHLAGRTLALEGFKESALGDVSLICRGGTLRALGVRAGNTASNVSNAAAVMGLFGALTGNSTATKFAEKGQAAADTVKQLGHIKFDQLNVVVARGDKRDVVIKEITLISPSVRLAGSGKIAYAPGVSLVQRPLAVDLQMGARDQLANNLRTLRLLSAGASDDLGYLPMVEPIKLDGTLQSIGTAQLQRLIDRAIAD